MADLTRWSASDVSAAIATLEDLTQGQVRHLTTLVDLMGADGQIVLSHALSALYPQSDDKAAIDSYKTFRSTVNKILGRVDGLRLSVDRSTKLLNSERRTWFEGENRTTARIAEFSDSESAGDDLSRLVDPLARTTKNPVIAVVSAKDVSNQPHYRSDIDRFVSMLTLHAQNRFEVRTGGDLIVGEEAEHAREELIRAAALVITLLDAEFASEADDLLCRVLAEARDAGKELPLLLAPLDLRHAELHGREIDNVFNPMGQAWSQIPSGRRDDYLIDLLGHVRLAVNASPVLHRIAPDLDEFFTSALDVRRPRGRMVAGARVVRSQLMEGGAPLVVRPRGAAVDAVAYIVDWATGPAAADGSDTRKLALLGDYGMGKTTTCRLVTQRLLDLRRAGQDAPLPVYLDLREAQGISIALLDQQAPDESTLKSLIQVILAKVQSSAAEMRLSAGDLMAQIAKGNCLVIFDGLDEIGAKLPRSEAQALIRVMWRALRLSDRAKSARPTRLLLSCRTHYFRDLRDETNYLTGEHRSGTTASDYETLLMLPFSREQIRRYLELNVGADADRFVELMDSVHDLNDLARRPFTLQLIASQLERIEQAHATGEEVSVLWLYEETVRQWIERDAGKETIDGEHKLELMEILAARMVESGRSSWSPRELTRWFTLAIDADPELRARYRNDDATVLEEDLRNATFVVRLDDDRFAFAHTSLAEYFVARYLLRALLAEQGQCAMRWALPRTSPETLDFLGQGVAGLRPEDRDRALVNLRAIAQQWLPGASELALAYGLRATERGWPCHDLRGSQLPGANLGGWVIDGANLSSSNLSDANLSRTRVTAQLDDSDLSRADLSCAEFLDSSLVGADLSGAVLEGTVFRRCDLHRTDVDAAHVLRTRLIESGSEMGARLSVQLMVVPHPEGRFPPARVVLPATGRGDQVISAAWSPDGSKVATVSRQGSAELWDATGERLVSLSKHEGPVKMALWSPGGSRVATAGADGSARVWDAEKGELQAVLAGRDGSTDVVAWSPDGSRLATACRDDRLRVWRLGSGEALSIPSAHIDTVLVLWSPNGISLATAGRGGSARVLDTTTDRTVTLQDRLLTSAMAWSPDGSRIAAAGMVGAPAVFDSSTGDLQLSLVGHDGPTSSIAWSPTGSRLATASGDCSARVWDASTGQPELVLSGHAADLNSVAWSPDGTRLATASADGFARVWDATTGKQLAELTGHVDGLNSVAWSPDGTRLLTAGADGSARVWDAKTGSVATEFWHFPDARATLAPTPDGVGRIVAASELAWRYLNWEVIIDGEALTVPAETYGPLPRFSEHQACGG